MVNEQYSGFERRKYFRYNLIYLSKKRVKFIVGDREYEVLDISRGGLRFLYNNEIEIEKQIQGIIKFSEDESTAVEGKIVWRKGSEVGLKFKHELPLFRIAYFQD
ncbi:MAG: PilZ domain-containing protein [Pseudomonadota bacterium]|uniref:PilZ domain-containing protein n=1 Tax=Candidatus Desulfatibia profunda TaxID=2841695 RepID=A0A8J6NXX1_9BACT|nr:PilZ domain-containing protein [Candidatus Desulfatibia profunda]MBL7180432.1 PilZ domain-containing protein [Desulfobacterales bacterium]